MWTLTDFLGYFGFDYRLYNNGEELEIGLLDLQGANLGEIEEERYQNTNNGVLAIVDRLDIYYKDYIFDDLEEILKENHHIDISGMGWKDLYDKVKELSLDYYMDIMPYIFGDKKLILDSNNKEVER